MDTRDTHRSLIALAAMLVTGTSGGCRSSTCRSVDA
jgi:hypothetical protein